MVGVKKKHVPAVVSSLAQCCGRCYILGVRLQCMKSQPEHFSEFFLTVETNRNNKGKIKSIYLFFFLVSILFTNFCQAIEMCKGKVEEELLKIITYMPFQSGMRLALLTIFLL